MAEEVFLTKEGLEELEKRLEYLKVEKRAEITERIKVARGFGDLSENAEYDAAKNEQAMIEGEILEIEEKIKHAKVFKAGKKGTVSLGSKVEVYDRGYDEVCVYEIVAKCAFTRSWAPRRQTSKPTASATNRPSATRCSAGRRATWWKWPFPRGRPCWKSEEWTKLCRRKTNRTRYRRNPISTRS